jgi:hypothetical protein
MIISAWQYGLHKETLIVAKQNVLKVIASLAESGPLHYQAPNP